MTAAGEVRDVGDFHGPMVVHRPAPGNANAVPLQGMVDGWANAGSFLRHHHCSAYRFRGFMAESRFANLCIRLIWGVAGSRYHIGSDQAQQRRYAFTK